VRPHHVGLRAPFIGSSASPCAATEALFGLADSTSNYRSRNIRGSGRDRNASRVAARRARVAHVERVVRERDARFPHVRRRRERTLDRATPRSPDSSVPASRSRISQLGERVARDRRIVGARASACFEEPIAFDVRHQPLLLVPRAPE
jgi:hypothetical protein